jgi:hypothetical protein
MAVSKGNNVQATDYTDALGRILVLLGDGSGQNGYGQIVPSYEAYKDVSANDEEINHDHLQTLKTDINTCSQHQSGNNAYGQTFSTGDIIGADASGTSVTYDEPSDSFTIDNPNNNKGFNDLLAAISTVETNAGLVDEFTISDPRTLTSSTRTTPWGGDGDPDDNIWCELDCTFEGGYATTNSAGRTVATGADHRRHFFNAGGDLRLTFTSGSNTSKDQNWESMFNQVTVVFSKNSTTATSGAAADGSTDVNGDGTTEPATGNFQLTTGYKEIFRKYGSDVYSENYYRVRAKRVNNNVVRFRIDFNDVNEGQPNFDERVLVSGGTQSAGIHAKQPTGDFVEVPLPDGGENSGFEEN